MKFAMVFPGQGSQKVGMLDDIKKGSDTIEQTVAQASEVLQLDMAQLIDHGPPETLNLTANAQPAILTASVAIWRVWCERTKVRPAWLAGHSLGEYSALVCAGVLDFATALKLVQKRGELMQQAVPAGQGAMAALLGLDDDDVKNACHQAADIGIVEAVNFNAPGQVVIAGQLGAVERACELAKIKGARRAQILPVSVPAHSSLMKDAAQQYAEYVRRVALSEPDIPVLHNVGIDQIDDIKYALIAQLYHPVPWTAIVRHLVSQECQSIIECGPGRVLSGLTKRIDKKISTATLNSADHLEQALEIAL